MELPIIFAYGALIALSGALWGIISLWTYRSNLPLWFRAAAPAVLLATFLRVPAYEPMVFFSVQMAVVLLGVWFWHLQNSSASVSGRFSLKNLLAFVVVISLWLSAVVRCEVDSLQIWLALFSGGLALGLTTLLAAWVATKKTRWVQAALVVAAVAIPVGSWETSILNLPEWDRAAVNPFTPGAVFNLSQTYPCYIAWLVVLEFSLLITTVGLSLANAASSNADSPKEPPRRFGFLLFLFLVAAPVAWVFWNTPSRLEQPTLEVTGRDGYDLFCDAKELYVNNPVLDDSRLATDQQLEAALKKNAKTFAKLEAAVDYPFRLEHREYDMQEMLSDAQFLRSAARMYDADAELAIRQQRYHRVVYDSLYCMNLASRMERVSYVLGLVANSVHAVGRHPIARVRNRLTPPQASTIIHRLSELEEQQPSFDEVENADKTWAERQWGWRCQLYNALSYSTGTDSLRPATDAFVTVTTRSSVARRLLAVDLGIRMFRKQRGGFPQSLDELSEIVPQHMMDDPYATQQHLKYQATTDGNHYLLYSVGPDGKDDGGEPIADRGYYGDGDLLLNDICGEIDPEPGDSSLTKAEEE